MKTASFLSDERAFGGLPDQFTDCLTESEATTSPAESHPSFAFPYEVDAGAQRHHPSSFAKLVTMRAIVRERTPRGQPAFKQRVHAIALRRLAALSKLMHPGELSLNVPEYFTSSDIRAGDGTPAFSKSLSFDQTARFKSSASTSTSSGSRLPMRRSASGRWRSYPERATRVTVGDGRREDLLDLFVPEHQSSASADDR
jgi:hypothetical protein